MLCKNNYKNEWKLLERNTSEKQRFVQNIPQQSQSSIHHAIIQLLLLNISRKEKYLLKRIFVCVLSVLLLCLKMLIFVLFYIDPCVFTLTRDSWKFILNFSCCKVWNISFVFCSVHHCDDLQLRSRILTTFINSRWLCSELSIILWQEIDTDYFQWVSRELSITCWEK